MNIKLICLLMAGVLLSSHNINASDKKGRRIESPNGNIFAELKNIDGNPELDVFYKNIPIIKTNRLGLIRDDTDFSRKLELISVSEVEKVEDRYSLLHGKKSNYYYLANRKTFRFINQDGKEIQIIFQVSDDGIAFRYYLPEKSDNLNHITDEVTTFNFDDSTIAWIQPIAEAKSGWNATNPSFEEHYTQCQVTELSNHKSGWMLPALFQSGKYWISLTETAPDRNYCGCRLIHDSLSNRFKIGFPQESEVFMGGALKPESKLPWYTPWRVITIGDNLGTLIESTLGTDLAVPSKLTDISFVKPGRSSWSWVLLKDDSTIYPVQKRFIDYASEMKWEYCLIDADWDRKIGYEKIAELCEYAKQKNVGIFLWYNSAGNWNTTPYTPRDKMVTKESRENEFQKLKAIGVKGIKVDFFGGDGQSVMTYYQDIFEDAARYGLMVNCHGATYPRGWQRTYPNLVSMEAIRGFEFVTFDQYNADKQAVHSTIIPFTRNLFDPMDFTPVCFSEVPNIKRRTTNSFELATAVLFLSGVQHYAEIPEGMAKVPKEVKDLMKEIPIAWDEAKFIDGYPGKHVVIARRYGNVWYIAGINGESIEKKLSLNLNFIPNHKSGFYISCGNDNRSFNIKSELNITSEYEVSLKAYDGFVIKLPVP